MKYLNTEKTLVLVDYQSVPKCHRLWDELNIEAAEEAGEIKLYSEPAPTKQQLIDELEARQTKRMLRSAIAGDKYAIEKLAEIESEIQAIRES